MNKSCSSRKCSHQLQFGLYYEAFGVICGLRPNPFCLKTSQSSSAKKKHDSVQKVVSQNHGLFYENQKHSKQPRKHILAVVMFMGPTRELVPGGSGDISSDRCCRQPEMDHWTCLGPKMGKGGFKLFVPDIEQKLMISWD